MVNGVRKGGENKKFRVKEEERERRGGGDKRERTRRRAKSDYCARGTYVRREGPPWKLRKHELVGAVNGVHLLALRKTLDALEVVIHRSLAGCR